MSSPLRSHDVRSQEFLAATTDNNLTEVELTNCNREPIHIPNLIQPHGVLLAVSADKYQILQVSLNTEDFLGLEPQELLGKSLADILGIEQTTAVKSCLSQDFDCINPLTIKFVKDDRVITFDGIVHLQENIIILELEIKQKEETVDFTDFYRSIKSPISKIQKTKNLEELCHAIAGEVKKIAGYDRVMIYRFDREGAGQVIAEAVEEGLEPFLGLRYPATDIPRQAKHLYTLNFIRLIPDVAYEPVGIIPQKNPLTNKSLDMSLSVLRSVSPLHTEYLNNMGVAASMSISLLHNQRLWGLIACHHNTPKILSYEVRTVCEFIGQIASFELAAKEKSQDADYKMKLKSIQSQFVKTISQAEELESGLLEKPRDLLELVGADGAAIVFDEEITTIGITPNEKAIEIMLPWLEKQFSENVIYETNSLTQEYSDAEAYAETASGLLALLISRVQKTLIIWFRREVIQTVNWGGNPHKQIEIMEDGSIRMSPRKSFAKWQEKVCGQSVPWKSCETEAALELRSSIVGIVLRKADEITKVNRELARSNTELDAFAYIASHDLKEPLRGIYNYSSFLIEDYSEILDEEGVNKLNTLMRLTHRMEDLINSLLHYSRLGRAELQKRPVNIDNLVAEVLDVIKVSARDDGVKFEIPRPLPTLKCDRTLVTELFTNLISNGIKYNQETHKIIEIGCLEPDHPIARQKILESSENPPIKTIFYVRDNGIGIRDKNLTSIFRIFKRLHGQKKYGGGTGAGLTIVKKIVERHGGEIWVESVYRKGSTFYFTLQ